MARHLEAYSSPNNNKMPSAALRSGSQDKGSDKASDVTEIGEALENILGFEALSAATRGFVTDVFRRRGFTVTGTQTRPLYSDPALVLNPNADPT